MNHEPRLLQRLAQLYDRTNGLEVQVQNVGSGEAVVFKAMSLNVRLDDTGAPLWWNDLKTPGEVDVTVAAGASVTVQDSPVTFGGDAPQALIFIPFKQP